MYTNGVSRELLAILDVSAKSAVVSRVYLIKYTAIHYITLSRQREYIINIF